MLTDGKYFDKYLKQLPITDFDIKNNALLSSLIKKLGSSAKFERFVLDLREQYSIPKQGYKHDKRSNNFSPIGYYYPDKTEKMLENIEKQHEVWGIPGDLRHILPRFILCNEPIYYDYRTSKGRSRIEGEYLKISIKLPINSKTELFRYISAIWPSVISTQRQKGYKKHQKRVFSKAERDATVRKIHNEIVNLPKEERINLHDDIISVIDSRLVSMGINISRDYINSII